jgi:SET domain-containing protein
MLLSSWISSKTTKGLPSKIGGKGFFALADIAKGEVVALKVGHVIDRKTLEANKDIIRDAEVQVSDELYLAPMSVEEFPLSMVYFNHSCEPNAGFAGNVLLVAMRDIKAGEEITLDYATHHTEPDYVMVCNCQQPTCRRTITGNDWKIPELQRKYAGYFNWYIEQKIRVL